jgi:hypothetical protein
LAALELAVVNGAPATVDPPPRTWESADEAVLMATGAAGVKPGWEAAGTPLPNSVEQPAAVLIGGTVFGVE